MYFRHTVCSLVAETNVGCTPEISIDIPTCALLELTLEYLQFNDPSCDLLDYVTPTATGFRITVPSFKCGAQSEVCLRIGRPKFFFFSAEYFVHVHLLKKKKKEKTH